MRVKMTERLLTTLKPVTAETCLWDSEVPGLGLRMRPSGARTWVFKRGRRWTLGVAGSISLGDARRLAQKAAVDLAEGREPTVGVTAERVARTAAMTVDDLLDRYLADHASSRCTASTKALYERVARLHVRPRIGKLRLDRIGHGEVDRMVAELSATPPTANLAFDLVRAAFAKGLRWKIRPRELGNPCEGGERYDVAGREHHLNAAELSGLLTVLGGMLSVPEDRVPALVLLALAATGCRRDEVRTLRWEWIDWQENRIRWPTTKTGAGELVLSAEAVMLLSAVHRDAGQPRTGVAFPGPKEDRPVGRDAVYRRWDAAKVAAVAAGLDADRILPTRPHDLRHSFASLALSSGMSLDDVRRLLRHKDRRSTERYAKWLPAAERELAQRVGRIVPSLPVFTPVP